MEFCCYVDVVSPTTPVRTACDLPMCKAGSYFRLRSLLLSMCSFVLAPDRTEPPLWECVPDLFASRLSISNFVCRYVKNIYINLTWRAGVIVVSKVAPAPLVSLSFVSERSSRGCFPSMLSSVSCGAGGVGGC